MGWGVGYGTKLFQVVSSLSSMQKVCKIRILGQFGIKNYAWKVGIIQKFFVNIANFLFVIFYTKMNMLMQRVKQDKSGTFNYKQSKQATACINGYSKVKLHGLVRPLNFISLGMDFLDPLDEWITDLLFQTNRFKHLTFKY